MKTEERMGIGRMLLKDITPFVRQAVAGTMSSKNVDDVFFKLRSIDCRLFWISGGNGEIQIEDQHYPLQRGTVILFNAGVEYAWRPHIGSAIEYIAINFDYTWSHPHLKTPFHPAHADVFREESILMHEAFSDAEEMNRPIVLQTPAVRESQFRQLVSEFFTRAEYSEEILSAMLKTILISIARETRSDQKNAVGGGSELTRQIAQYVQKHYKDPISYQTLGEVFHMSPIYMNRVFKRYMKTSLHEYLFHYRINMAMELLRSSNIPVKEIAQAVGFADFPHFSKSFKKLTGRSPSVYRNSVDE